MQDKHLQLRRDQRVRVLLASQVDNDANDVMHLVVETVDQTTRQLFACGNDLAQPVRSQSIYHSFQLLFTLVLPWLSWGLFLPVGFRTDSLHNTERVKSSISFHPCPS